MMIKKKQVTRGRKYFYDFLEVKEKNVWVKTQCISCKKNGVKIDKMVKKQWNRLPKLRLKTEPFDWSTGSDLILQQQIMASQIYE